MSKLIKALITILSCILICIIGVSLFYQLRRNYKFVEVDNNTRQMYINYLNKQVASKLDYSSKQEIRTMLEAELDFNNYIYKEGIVENGGYSVATLRYIKVDKDLNIEQYCIVLCHEMCHIKYFTGNEIYTQFMAFKTLYESDNEELKTIGTWFGIYVLNRGYRNNYDCSKLIIDYLKERLC